MPRGLLTSHGANIVVVVAIGFVHFLAVGFLIHSAAHTPGNYADIVMPVDIKATVTTEERMPSTVPVPEVRIKEINSHTLAISQVRFEFLQWGDITNVTANSSTPQLSSFQPVDVAVFARRAGLLAGQVISVVLSVEVLENGTVGRVELIRGSANERANAAAVAYAKKLRWTPGTESHHAQSMRIMLPISLIWNS